MKKLLSLGTFALVFGMLALPVNAASFVNIPAGPIKMDSTDKPVNFDHTTHTSQDCTACHAKTPKHFPPLVVDTEKQCAVCHHKVAGTTPRFKCGTAGCHDTKDMQSQLSYFRIIHDPAINGEGHAATSCLACHTDVVKDRTEKKQALTGCSGSACHPKAN